MAGVVETGFEAATAAELLEAIQDFQRIKISEKLDFSPKSPLGAINPIVSDHEQQAWQVAEEAYHAMDLTGATDDRVTAIGLTMGVPRRSNQPGLVATTCNFGAGLTLAPGDLVAQVSDEPENLWENRDEVVTTSGGLYSVVFVSQVAGDAAVAPAGTLTVIPTPVAGWISVTNPSDAQPGYDLESVDALRIRIAQSTGAGASRTVQAIRAALVALDGVLSVDVFENRGTSTDANGVPAHSIRPVIWDGSPPAANDDEIAQTIWDRSSTYSHGSQTGTAQDSELGAVDIHFDRASAVACTVAVNIESASTVRIADVRAAILAAWPNGGQGLVGVEVTYHRIAGSVFSLAGVDDYASFTINGGTADLAANPVAVYQLNSADVTVTGDVV